MENKCGICDKTFRKKKLLGVHLKIHKESKTFADIHFEDNSAMASEEQNYCNMTFSTKLWLCTMLKTKNLNVTSVINSFLGKLL